MKASDILLDGFDYSSESILEWVFVNTNSILSSNVTALIDTSANVLTINLPENPKVNDEIRIVDAKGTFNINNVTITTLKKIKGNDDDIILDKKGTYVSFVYISETYGWKYNIINVDKIIGIPFDTTNIDNKFILKYNGTSFYFEQAEPLSNPAVLYGPLSGTEETDITISIDNYNATFIYDITVGAGTFTRTNNIITWSLPEVTMDTTYDITVTVTEAGKQPNPTIKHVLVEDFPITGDTTLLVENTDWDNGISNGTTPEAIATSGAGDWEYFEINGDSYLALANYDNVTYNLNSKIYKYNGTSFIEFQSIATHGARDWEYFEINGESYLVVANFSNDITHNVNSKIYKWNGALFVEFQSIATNGAEDCQYFEINNESYLAVANNYNDSTRNTDSKIYKYNGTSFIEFQSIATSGATDWEYFTIGTDHYLVVSNYDNGTTHNIDSYIYKWNTGTLQFDEYQSIATNGARNWKYFEMNGESYLALANNYNGTTHNIDSYIYKWNTGTLQFDEYQSIATVGAHDWESFEINGDSYLAVANYRNNTTFNVNSYIYKYNGTSFIEFQSIATHGVYNWEYFEMNGNNYLAVANYHNDSLYNIDSYIYKWSIEVEEGEHYKNININSVEATDDSAWVMTVPEYQDSGDTDFTEQQPTINVKTESFNVDGSSTTSSLVLDKDATGINDYMVKYSGNGLTAMDGNVNNNNLTGYSDSINYGTESVFNSGVTECVSSIMLDSTHVIVSYSDGTYYNSSTHENVYGYGTSIIGTINGTSITWGNESVFNGGGTQNISSVLIDSTHILVSYRDYGNNSYGTSIIGTINGTSITWGNESVFSSSVDMISSVMIDSTHVLISQYGKSIIGTINGTSITWGTTSVFNSRGNSYISSVMIDSTHVLVSYRDNGNNWYGKSIIGTISGTNITWGTASVFNSGDTYYISSVMIDSTHVLISYDDHGNNKGTFIIGTINGTSITWGTESVFNNGGTSYISSAMIDSTHVLINYSNNDYGTSIIGTINGTSITWGTTSVFNSEYTNYNSSVMIDSTHVLISYMDGGNNRYGTSIIANLGRSSTLTLTNPLSAVPELLFSKPLPDFYTSIGTENEFIPASDVHLTNLTSASTTSITGDSTYDNLWITDGYHNTIGLTINGSNTEVTISSVSKTGTGPYTYTLTFDAQAQAPTDAWKPNPFTAPVPTIEYNPTRQDIEMSYPLDNFKTVPNIRQLKYYMDFNSERNSWLKLTSDLYKEG